MPRDDLNVNPINIHLLRHMLINQARTNNHSRLSRCRKVYLLGTAMPTRIPHTPTLSLVNNFPPEDKMLLPHDIPITSRDRLRAGRPTARR